MSAGDWYTVHYRNKDRWDDRKWSSVAKFMNQDDAIEWATEQLPGGTNDEYKISKYDGVRHTLIKHLRMEIVA